MLVYFNDKIVDQNEVFISPFDRGFQFSDGVYEVIRYYPQKFFRLEAHIARLKYSLREMEIREPDLQNLEFILYELINKNDLTNEPSIAYLQVTRGNQFPRRHVFDEITAPTFFIYVEKFPAKSNDLANGIKAGLEQDIRWHRCDIKSVALIPNILSKSRAAKNGLTEIIWHRGGIITEGTQTNIFFVKDKTLFTPQLSPNILAGITRATVIELANKLLIKCIEGNISIEELNYFDEIFLASTTAEVTSVIEIAGIKINNGVPGQLAQLLQCEYRALYL
jgi:D-alanine transaminase